MIINWLCKIFKAYKTCDLLKEKEKEAEYWKREYFKKCADYNVLLQKYEDLKRKYLEDIAYYESRIKNLLKLLERSIQIPTIKLQETPEEIWWNTLESVVKDQCEVIEIEIADYAYWTVSKQEFERILKQINEKIKATWTEEVFDCDDFALLMAGLVAYTCYKSGFKKQLAFGIAWSNVHAYNLYVDKNLTVWVWEPQTATTVGKLADLKNDSVYGTRYVWFME